MVDSTTAVKTFEDDEVGSTTGCTRTRAVTS